MYQLFNIGVYCFLFVIISDKIIIKEEFKYPDGPAPKNLFWSEGCPGNIRNGRLFIDADTAAQRASSVWLNQELSGDLSIEFDVFLLSSSDDANNINLFFMYGDASGDPLKQTASQRQDGLYQRYHKLKGFIVTNVTNNDSVNIRYRLRKNPGFTLVRQSQMKRIKRQNKIHIKLLKQGEHFQYWENDNKIFDEQITDADKQYAKGLFGFRTWHTSMEIDNLLIKRIE